MNDFMDWRAARDPELKGAADDCAFGDWLVARRGEDPDPVHRPRLPRLRRRG